MRTIMVELFDDGLSLSNDTLGRAGEKNVVQFSINFDALRDISGLTTATLLYQPRNSPVLAMPSVEIPEGDLVTLVPDWAMAVFGITQVQLQLTGEGVETRSYIWDMRVERSLINYGDKPTPVQDWLQEVRDVIDDAASLTGLKIIDFYPSYDELVASVTDPNPGDAYATGDVPPYDVYVYGETSGWVNVGPMNGGGTGTGGGGVIFIPSVSAVGTLSWENNGDLPNPEPVNLMGPRGAKGDKGDTGARGAEGAATVPRLSPLMDTDTGKSIGYTLEWLLTKRPSVPSGSFIRHGVSPTIVVDGIDGGHRVTVTDADGTKSFDVLDGKDGAGDDVTAESIKDALGYVPANQEEVDQLSEEIAVIGDCVDASRVYVGGWTEGRIESGTHKVSTGHAYSEIIDNTFDSPNYFFDTSFIERMMVIYCDEGGSVVAYNSWVTEPPVVVANKSRPKYRLQVKLLDDTRAGDLPQGVYRVLEVDVPPIVDKVLSVERKTSAVYVDGATGSDANTGTKDAPYKTIQMGVDSGAKIVYVETGEYSETVSVSDRDDITIMPASYSSTYIEGIEETPKIHIDGGEGKTIGSFSVVDCGNVTIIGVWVDNSNSHGFYINRVKNAEFVDCVASNCLGEDSRCGYKIISANGVFRGCKAYNINRDGFGISGYGRTDFFDCTAYDCGDDGISHHYGCTGSIVGGEWYRCGKGGVSSPTYGAYVDVRNVYSHDNQYGLYTTSDSAHRMPRGWISNCVFKGNTTNDIYINRSNITALNVVYDTKSVTETGVLTEFPATN